MAISPSTGHTYGENYTRNVYLTVFAVANFFRNMRLHFAVDVAGNHVPYYDL